MKARIVFNRNSPNFTYSYMFLILLLCLIHHSRSSLPSSSNLLSTSVMNSTASNGASCCFGQSVCVNATPSTWCAFDNNASTVWTLVPGQLTANLTIILKGSFIVDRVELDLDPMSIIPSSVSVTAYSESDNESVEWISYFNKICQPNDRYFRRRGSKYFSCSQDITKRSVTVPEGLFSVKRGNDEWIWWRPFQRLQMTVTATNSDYNNTSNRFIAIADFRLFGWNQPVDVCNCHPAGVNDTSTPCDQNKTCICRDTQATDQQCIPETGLTGAEPTYGPQSGGTTLLVQGNNLLRVDKVVVGSYDVVVGKNSETLLTFATNPANKSDVGRSLPIFMYFDQPQGVSSFIIVNGYEFMYKLDPVIKSITPGSSILRGGIRQTVIGENLDSIYLPFMTILEKKPSYTNYYNFTNPLSYPEEYKNRRFCSVLSSTEMHCWCPSLIGIVEDQRTTIEVRIGLDINGSYENCNIVEKNCLFNALPDPTLSTNLDPTKVVDYPVYKGRIPLKINGQNFYDSVRGPAPKDYTITVGGVPADNISAVTNVIQYYPPDSDQIDPNKPQDVKLVVGFLTLSVTRLHYCTSWIECPENRNSLIGGLVGGVGGLILLLVLVFLIVTLVRRCSNPVPGPGGTLDYETLALVFNDDETKYVTKYAVEYGRLQLGSELGKGNFGTVYQGTFLDSDGKTREVAIKTLHSSGTIHLEEKLEFIREAMMMADFSHIHVLSLIAISLHNQQPYVVLPLMEHGDLREFVSKPQNSFTAGDLVNFCLQVAEGMAYLASRKFVHRDLAARNCMINRNFLVKVADFGLARDIFERDYYRSSQNDRPLPFKWMALECLKSHAAFSESSDVWSYGVLVWELMTRGKRPYSDIDNIDLRRYLEQGRRLEKPENAPEFMYDLMRRCWLSNVNDRPTFKKIVTELREILSIDQSNESQSQNGGADRNFAEDARKSYLQLVDE